MQRFQIAKHVCSIHNLHILGKSKYSQQIILLIERSINRCRRIFSRNHHIFPLRLCRNIRNKFDSFYVFVIIIIAIIIRSQLLNPFIKSRSIHQISRIITCSSLLIHISRQEACFRSLLGQCIKRISFAITQCNRDSGFGRLRKDWDIDRPKGFHNLVVHIHLYRVATVGGSSRQGREVESIALAYTERRGGSGRNHYTADAFGSIRKHFGCYGQGNESRDMLELEVHTTFRDCTHGITERTDGTIVIINRSGRSQTDQLAILRHLCFGIPSIDSITIDCIQRFRHRHKLGSSDIFLERGAIHQVSLGRGGKRNPVTILPKGTDTVALVAQHHTRIGPCTGSDTHFLLQLAGNDVFFFRTACQAQGHQGKQHIFEFHIILI